MKRFLAILFTIFSAGVFPIGASSQHKQHTIQAISLLPTERGLVLRAQTALNNITTMKARFHQTSSDGKQTDGTVWIERPGRFRFEYDKPSPLLLVANNGQIIFHDEELQQTTSMPLDKTPLGLLLRSDLTFDGDVTLTGFNHANNQLRLSIVRTLSPSDGSLTLIFQDDPFHLLSWRVTDNLNRTTEVNLSDIHFGVSISPYLFDTAMRTSN